MLRTAAAIASLLLKMGALEKTAPSGAVPDPVFPFGFDANVPVSMGFAPPGRVDHRFDSRWRRRSASPAVQDFWITAAN